MSREKTFVVAVVDDDSRVLRSLESLLESVGHTPRLFASAESFLAANGLQEVDCLISDIGMPGMSGLELEALARAARPELPVFLLTGWDAYLSPAGLSDWGPARLFLKPLNGLELLGAIDSAMSN